MAKKIHVLRPPLTLYARYAGTPAIRPIKTLLLKYSLPEASAGRGAFLIAGNYNRQLGTTCLVQRSYYNYFRRKLTAVVLTPYLLFAGAGASAAGVSMKSIDSSEKAGASLRSDIMGNDNEEEDSSQLETAGLV